jgi:hypothetical protein
MSQQSQSVHKKTKHTEQNTEQTVHAQAQRRKLRIKNSGGRKKNQSNKQQAAKEHSKSRKEKQFHKRSTAHNKVQEKKQGEN